MANRRLLYIISFILIFILAILVGQQFFRLPFKRASVFEAVPITVPLFVSLSNLNPGAIPDTLAPRFQSWLSLLPGVDADYQLMKDLLNKPFWPSGDKQEIVFMIQKVERDIWGMSVVADVGRAANRLENVLKTYPVDALNKTQFKGQFVYQINPPNGQSFSIGQYRNLLIISRLPIAVEDAFRQLSDYRSNIWWQDAGQYTKSASVYIKPGLFSDFFRNQMEPKEFERLQEMESSFKWAKFDLQMSDDHVQLQGQLLPGPGDKKIEAFSLQEEQVPEVVFRLIPEDIAMFYYWGYSDFQKYYESINVPVIDRFERFIKPWVGNEIVQVMVDPAAVSTCMLIKTRDPEIARHTLDRLLGEAGQLKAYRYNTFYVQQVMEEDLFGFLPFGPVTALRNPHITFLEDYVLFAPSQSAMEIWLDQYLVGNTLAGNTDFIKFREINPGAFHHLLYLNANNWPRVEKMKTLNPFLDQFPYLGLGLKGAGEVFDLEANWTPEVQADTLGNFLWRVNLSSEVILAPEIVQLGKVGAQVVVTQDAFYNFYVFEAGGELLWQKKLDGPVYSPVHSFDYYGDAQFHLLFNTPNNIYLLDEQGRDMSNFPIPLRSPASTGLTFVDFKQDNNPAFFVAGENGQVYGFDRKGQPLVGWNPLFDAGNLKHPLLYFQKGANDYLVALSDTANIKVFAKNGEKRFELSDSTAVFHAPPAYQINEQSSRIVAVDQKGIAHILNLEGEYFKLALQVGQNESVQFAFADVIGNINKDYIALSGKDLAIYHYANQGFVKALSHQFDQEQDSLFAVKLLQRQKKLIGSLNKKRGQIHLLNARGKSVSGFPISGTTPFSIVDLYGDGRPVVLGANGTSVFGMLLSVDSGR